MMQRTGSHGLFDCHSGTRGSAKALLSITAGPSLAQCVAIGVRSGRVLTLVVSVVVGTCTGMLGGCRSWSPSCSLPSWVLR
jgi:hypothetical protein